MTTAADSGTGLVLVTGATGKVGQVFLERFLADDRFAEFKGLLVL